MNILVTGAAGFIGSSLADRLVADGHVVYGIDNFDSYYDRSTKERNLSALNESTAFRFYEADLRDRQALATVFGTAAEAGRSIDVVVHLAAKAGVRPSIEDPLGYTQVNVDGTVNLLEAMSAGDVRDLVFASSSSVYGNTKEVPFREDAWVDHPDLTLRSDQESGGAPLSHVLAPSRHAHRRSPVLHRLRSATATRPCNRQVHPSDRPGPADSGVR
jgi:UDP-glucuronate 4-epimerase